MYLVEAVSLVVGLFGCSPQKMILTNLRAEGRYIRLERKEIGEKATESKDLGKN